MKNNKTFIVRCKSIFPFLFVLLAGCAELTSTHAVYERDKHKYDMENKEAEIEYACKFCSNEPKVGRIEGIKLSIDLKRDELNSAKARIGIERYSKLSQELAGYSAEWEALYDQVTTACKQYAVCLRRNDNSGICNNADGKYQDKIDKGNDLVFKIKQLSAKQ